MTEFNPDTWNPRWLDMAEFIAGWSKDHHRRCGAVIVSPAQAVLSLGWNGFPRGVDDSIEARYERPNKYMWTVHAERNAIYNAARCGIATEGARMYVKRHPCTGCSQGIIQCGIAELFTTEPDFSHPRHGEDWRASVQMLAEAKIKVHYL